MFSPGKAGRNSLKKRRLRLETLEKREMLSVTPPVEVTGAMVTIYSESDQIYVVGEDSHTFYTGDIADIEKLTIQSTDNVTKVITVDMGRGGAFDFTGGLHIQGSGEDAETIVKLVGSKQDNTFLVERSQVTLNALVVTTEGVSSMRLEGGEADDTYKMLGLGLNTTIYDADGTNHLDFSGYTSAQTHGVTVSLASTTPQQVFADDPLHTLAFSTTSSIQNLTGTPYADTLRGNSLDNEILGGAGNDIIYGGAGSDTIDGGTGDDTIYADSGSNFLYAGEGGTNRIFGGTGNDRLFGSSGNDRLEAGEGNNLLVGGGGNDILTASDGRNVLLGGSGEDVITTGAGESIVVTGETAYDDYAQPSSRNALEAIYATWNSNGSRDGRVDALREGVGDNGDVVLDATTVTNDGDDVANTVNGAAGKNWVFASEADILNGVTDVGGKDIIGDSDDGGGDDDNDYEALTTLETDVAAMMESEDATAIAITVTEAGELLASLGDELLYPIGSLYNLMVTAGVMKLVESDDISLDDSVVTLLDQLLQANQPLLVLGIPAGSNLRDITVQMLLNGSSGLPVGLYAAETVTPARDAYLESVLEYLAGLENVLIEPGTRTQGGDTGFLLAEYLIREISEQSLEEFFNEHFLQPAGITGFVWDAEELIAGQDNVAKPGSELVWNNTPSAGSGVYATPEAVAALLGIFTGTTTDTDGQPLLSEESIAAMAENQLAEYWQSEDDTAWNNAVAPGLGWDCVADPVLEALGVEAWVQTSRVGENLTVYLVVPEYELILTANVVLNPEAVGETISADTLRGLLTETVINILEEKEVAVTFPDEITYAGEAAELPENFADTYAGYYAAYGEVIRVEVSNGNLQVSTRTASDGWSDDVVYEYREDAEGNGWFVTAGDETTNLKFAEAGDSIYIVTTVIDTTYGIAEISSVSHQKLSDMVWNDIWEAADIDEGDRDAVLDTWMNDRAMKVFALEDDYYSSQSLAQPRVRLDYDMNLEGYIFVEFEGGYYVFQVVDENTAVPVLDLPGEAGTQLPTLVFTEDTAFTLGNVTYRQTGSFDSLPDGTDSQAYASGQWIHVPVSGDETLEITVPENGRVLIFDASFNLLRDTFIDDDTFEYDAGEELYIYVTSQADGQWEITRI